MNPHLIHLHKSKDILDPFKEGPPLVQMQTELPQLQTGLPQQWEPASVAAEGSPGVKEMKAAYEVGDAYTHLLLYTSH